MKTIPVLALALFVTFAHVRSVAADDLAEVRKLVPSSAAMSLSDFDKLAMSTAAPKPSDLESRTLTLMLFALKVTHDEKTQEEFRYLTDGPPKPVQLAKEITRFVRGRGRFRFALGPVTLIHADRITDCTCKVDGDKARGTVSFKVPKLFQGKVNYVARRREGKWGIEEFAMPAHDIHIVLGDNGKWVQE